MSFDFGGPLVATLRQEFKVGERVWVTGWGLYGIVERLFTQNPSRYLVKFENHAAQNGIFGPSELEPTTQVSREVASNIPPPRPTAPDRPSNVGQKYHNKANISRTSAHTVAETSDDSQYELNPICKIDPKYANGRPNDPVNKPAHYQGKVETIDAIESSMSAEAFKGYLQGNAMKYLSRWSRKNGLEDLKKCQWYLERLIDVLEEE
ncbi:MAG: DUF3310 domain-containing protein [Solirubrobacterales bacterium]